VPRYVLNSGHLLGSLLRAWPPPGAAVVASDAKLAFGPEQCRRPDLTVYPRWHRVLASHEPASSHTPRYRHRDRLPHSWEPPDRVEKVVAYAAFRVRYYWIVDPNSAAWRS